MEETAVEFTQENHEVLWGCFYEQGYEYFVTKRQVAIYVISILFL